MQQGSILTVLIGIITILLVVSLVSPLLTTLISYSGAKSELLVDFNFDADVYFSKGEVTVRIVIGRLVGLDRYYIEPNGIRIIAPNGEYVEIKPTKYVPQASIHDDGGLVGYTLDEAIEVGRYTIINIYIPYQGNVDRIKGRWIVEVDIYDGDGDLFTTMVAEATLRQLY